MGQDQSDQINPIATFLMLLENLSRKKKRNLNLKVLEKSSSFSGRGNEEVRRRGDPK